MKKILYLSILSVAGLVISCKEKAKETSAPADSLSVETKSPESSSDDFKAQITSSDFDKIQKLADTKSDTVYITNYWATWCPPCVEEIPDFVALQEEYKDKKVKFTFVSVDDPDAKESEVIPFVQQHKMKNVYQIPAMELRKFHSFNPELTQGIPVTVIQKGEHKEGMIGGRPKDFMIGKIEEYLSKK